MSRITPFAILFFASVLGMAQSTPAPNIKTSPPINLETAIKLARSNAPQLRAALAEAGIAREDRVQARAALLPGVSYSTGMIYTEPNGTPEGSFISANTVHEYISQGVVHEGLSYAGVADYQRARAAEAVGRAKLEIAQRGLIATVTQDFYAVLASRRKRTSAEAANGEAQNFLKLSQQLEHGGEVAHSDTIKARLQANDRARDLQEAVLAERKATLDLAVLIFPNFTRDYELQDDLEQVPDLPDAAHLQELASKHNPEIAAATAAYAASQKEVTSAVAGHLPSLSFNYLYGIDAPTYSTYTNGIRNLGYQASATIDVPIFSWGAVQSKVRQAQLRRDQAKSELASAHRQAIANLEEFYLEAQSARSSLDLLRQSSADAAESLRLTTLRYRGGEATALEVVDAQNTLVQAASNLADGEVRYHVAIANLQTLTGTF